MTRQNKKVIHKPKLTRKRKKDLLLLAKMCNMSKSDLSRLVFAQGSAGYDLNQTEAYLLGTGLPFQLATILANLTGENLMDYITNKLTPIDICKRLVAINGKYTRQYRFINRKYRG